MSIHRRIRDHLLPMAEKMMVRDVRIGLGYTAVQLENGQTGVALTFREDLKRGCNVFQGLFPLAGRAASDMINLLDSEKKIEMAVGLATANALANKMGQGYKIGDTLEYLHISPEDRVGMVGFFAPMLPRLKKRASDLLIFEKVKKKEGDLLPEEDAYRLLPECHVAVITSTAIVNHTLDRLLEAARSCREVVLLGASTPLLPQCFRETPVTFLSGVIVTKPEEILRIVSEGQGMRFFKENVKKVNINGSYTFTIKTFSWRSN